MENRILNIKLTPEKMEMNNNFYAGQNDINTHKIDILFEGLGEIVGKTLKIDYKKPNDVTIEQEEEITSDTGITFLIPNTAFELVGVVTLQISIKDTATGAKLSYRPAGFKVKETFEKTL